jgi:UDP-3-O-[3-hydroxymyristoyl] N-acetylglucosamine deacetylase/3-hydroxyacyl-[acyl-carrier-protein] dehydratase
MIRRTVPQKTISKESSLSGVGLHTGKNVNLTFKPAPSNTGLVFIREDIEGDNSIEANIKFIQIEVQTWIMGHLEYIPLSMS